MDFGSILELEQTQIEEDGNSIFLGGSSGGGGNGGNGGSSSDCCIGEGGEEEEESEGGEQEYDEKESSPYLEDTSEHGGTRGSITLSSVPVCYRRVKSRKLVPNGVFMDVQVFQFESKESLKKCPASHKNQERIFVCGDTVGVIMTFDPFTYDDDVWFIVTRHKNGSKRLWRRKWRDLRVKITTVPKLAYEQIGVFEIGVVGEDPKVRNLVSLRDAVCLCIKVGDRTRQNTLWIEMGMFRVWSPLGVDVESFISKYCSEVTVNMKY